MGPDIEVSQSGSVGQREPQRGFESTLSASGFEDVGDGAGAEGVAFEGECDGGGQLLRPVVVEQGEQPGGVRCGIRLSLSWANPGRTGKSGLRSGGRQVFWPCARSIVASRLAGVETKEK